MDEISPRTVPPWSEIPMTKLSLVPLNHENKNSRSSIPQKGVIVKIESSCDNPNDGEASLLVGNRQSERSSIPSDTPGKELKEEDLTTLTCVPLAGILDSQYKSNGPSILCIEERRVLEADSGPASRNSIDEGINTPHGNKKSETLILEIKSDVVEDSISVEQNDEECETRSSGSLVKVSEEMKIDKQNFPSKFVPLWGLTSICGRRKEMEDSVVALPSFLKIPSSMLGDGPQFSSMDQDSVAHLFGVYDGHGGCQVANYCQDRLHLALAEEIGIAKDNWHNETGKHNWEEQWTKIFLNCFHKMDDEVGGFSRFDGDIASNPSPLPIAPDSVGSTAVVAVVCSTYIIVANCGDSRAVLCRGRQPVPLSVDHKPNREDERARIEAAGGKVINWNGHRVSGFLAVSRSIGDGYLRPYVVADPDLMLVPRAKEDQCLILASDGLWDVITNEEACDLARKRILLWHKKNGPNLSKERGKEIDPAAQDAADFLSQLAFQRGSLDNITVIVIDLKAQRKFKKRS